MPNRNLKPKSSKNPITQNGKKDFVLELQKHGPDSFLVQILDITHTIHKEILIGDLDFRIREIIEKHTVTSWFSFKLTEKFKKKKNRRK